jgi:hypothetical protein
MQFLNHYPKKTVAVRESWDESQPFPVFPEPCLDSHHNQAFFPPSKKPKSPLLLFVVKDSFPISAPTNSREKRQNSKTQEIELIGEKSIELTFSLLL